MEPREAIHTTADWVGGRCCVEGQALCWCSPRFRTKASMASKNPLFNLVFPRQERHPGDKAQRHCAWPERCGWAHLLGCLQLVTLGKLPTSWQPVWATAADQKERSPNFLTLLGFTVLHLVCPKLMRPESRGSLCSQDLSIVPLAVFSFSIISWFQSLWDEGSICTDSQ